jgi:hypothetical protein
MTLRGSRDAWSLGQHGHGRLGGPVCVRTGALWRGATQSGVAHDVVPWRGAERSIHFPVPWFRRVYLQTFELKCTMWSIGKL